MWPVKYYIYDCNANYQRTGFDERVCPFLPVVSKIMDQLMQLFLLPVVSKTMGQLMRLFLVRLVLSMAKVAVCPDSVCQEATDGSGMCT